MNPVVTYRVFMRTPVMLILKFVLEYMSKEIGPDKYDFKAFYQEGDIVEAKKPLFEFSGKFQDLVEHETAILQLLGWSSVCAYNAWQIRQAAPKPIRLMDMAARHCPGPHSVIMASYAAFKGGFDDFSTDIGSSAFGKVGVGTMPHAWIGAFVSTVDSAVAYADAFPDEKISVLVDYYGKELTDSMECYKALGDRLGSVRIDTHGGRFCEGSEPNEVVAWNWLQSEYGFTLPMWDCEDPQHVTGKGVTVEALYRLRQALNSVGGNKVKIVVSSGFCLDKVKEFVKFRAPIDVIGTGSFLPVDMRDTYATADIVAYNGMGKIKVGREFLCN